ncbi:STAS domain-containing protein [Kineococcus sp. NBC_00420]|uniref:STAS domain-containing protein n=1 Tax=Kineococcus sp. NBC_00420 TaxID=2903564 RepID=UPI002E1F10E4
MNETDRALASETGSDTDLDTGADTDLDTGLETSQIYDRGDAVGGGQILIDHTVKRTTITLHGEVDAAIGGRLDTLREEARAAGHDVTVDVGAVSFMDSTGLAFLAQLIRSSTAQPVRLLNPAPQVAYLLTISGLNDLFDIDIDDGVATS